MNKIILSSPSSFLRGFPRHFLGRVKQEAESAGPARKAFSNGAGFTLIELMVTMAILLIVIGGAYAALSSGRIFWFSQNAAITVQDEARRALDYMAMELTQAVNIDSDPATMAVDNLTTVAVNSIAFQIPVFCDGEFDKITNPNGDGFRLNVDGNSYYIESVVGQSTIDAGAYLPGDDISSVDPARTNRRIVYSLGGLDNSQLIRTVERISDGVQIDTRVLANNVADLRFHKRNTFTTATLERRIIIVEVDVSKNIFLGREAAGDPVNRLSLTTRATLRN